MKKLAIAAIAAALLVGPAGAAAVSNASGTTAPERTHVKRLVLHEIEGHSPAPDHFTGVDRLRSFATHRIAGYDNFSGVLNPKTDRLRFWLAISLKGGLIDSFFNVHAGGEIHRFSGKITHGYGKFRGIEGRVHVRGSNTDRTVYVLRYRL